jgi:4-hydroxybenzoate polyprenyltransferase
MKSLFHFLRLVRFGNLMVIGLTMCIIQIFIATHGNSSLKAGLEEFILKDSGYLTTVSLKYNLNLEFFFLILSVVLIAAAGNVINDYFDVKADRVNKPEKLIIGKYIKRRWAIMFNWIFNASGLLIALYLSYVNHNWWIVIIAFLIINFLWFYSAIYKRKLIVGNILVALMIGIVPIYVFIFNWPLDGYTTSSTFLSSSYIVEVVFIISILAFSINFMREIIKDIADIRGDLHLSAKTVPIVLGKKRSKIILIILSVPLLFLMFFYVGDVALSQQHVSLDINPIPSFKSFYFCISFSAFCVIISMITLITGDKRKIYILSSNLLKLAMLFGMISPLFL